MLRQIQLAVPLLLTWQHGCQLCSVTWMPAVLCLSWGLQLDSCGRSPASLSAPVTTPIVHPCVPGTIKMCPRAAANSSSIAAAAAVQTAAQEKAEGAAARFVNTACGACRSRYGHKQLSIEPVCICLQSKPILTRCPQYMRITFHPRVGLTTANDS